MTANSQRSDTGVSPVCFDESPKFTGETPVPL